MLGLANQFDADLRQTVALVLIVVCVLGAIYLFAKAWYYHSQLQKVEKELNEKANALKKYLMNIAIKTGLSYETVVQNYIEYYERRKK